MTKKGQTEKTIGIVTLGLGILTFLGVFGNFNPTPGCQGILGFFTTLLGVCASFNQPVGFVLIAVGAVLYFLGMKKHG